MIHRLAAALAIAAPLIAGPALAEEPCADPKEALGVSRIVEIDTKTGPLFGAFTKYEKEPRFLGPREVVLTFDDGPLPKHTKPILDALDKFCTKATFFSVGRMAQAYPSWVQEVMGRGHTMGTHTWSHPMNMRALSLDNAKDQIERGFAAVALAAGQPIAPFFRFPGLSDSGPLLAYLQQRGIAAFTVDVVSNDSYIASPARLAARTIALAEQQNGGILLFHDIKASTAAALPTILAELKKRGFKVVHMRAKAPFEPLPALTADLEAKQKAAEEKKAGGKAVATDTGEKPKLVPFYAAIAATSLDANAAPEVIQIAPDAKERVHSGGTHATASAPAVSAEEAASGTTVTQPPGTSLTQGPAKKHAHSKKRKLPPSDPLSITDAIGGRW